MTGRPATHKCSFQACSQGTPHLLVTDLDKVGQVVDLSVALKKAKQLSVITPEALISRIERGDRGERGLTSTAFMRFGVT